MKICFFLYDLFDIGGIQRVVSVLASELVKTHEVYIQCYNDPSEEDRSIYNLSEKVHVIFLKRYKRHSTLRKVLRKWNKKSGILGSSAMKELCEYSCLLPEERKMYRDIIEDKEIDIAIACGGFESYLLASIADEVECKTIGWQHSSYKAYYETKGMGCWATDHVAIKYLPKLDRVIVLNEYDAECFFEKQHLQCTTIYNPKSFKTQLQAQLSSKRFISAGRLIPVKAFSLLIESFRIFAQKNKDWTLTIYGEGMEREMLEAKIKKYGLEQRVFLPGFSASMKENLLQSSCYLLSSLWEGMPMVVLESLECGVPVIAYDLSAMAPLVDDAVEGFVVEQFDTKKFAQAMLDISADDELRRKMGRAAKKKAEKFEVEYIAEQWNRMFFELIPDVSREGWITG